MHLRASAQNKAKMNPPMHRRRFLATAALAAAPNIVTASKTAHGLTLCRENRRDFLFITMTEYHSGKVPPCKLHRLPG